MPIHQISWDCIPFWPIAQGTWNWGFRIGDLTLAHGWHSQNLSVLKLGHCCHVLKQWVCCQVWCLDVRHPLDVNEPLLWQFVIEYGLFHFFIERACCFESVGAELLNFPCAIKPYGSSLWFIYLVFVLECLIKGYYVLMAW